MTWTLVIWTAQCLIDVCTGFLLFWLVVTVSDQGRR